MSRTYFWKGVGAGLALGAAAGLMIPRRSRCSRRVSRLLKLAGSAMGNIGGLLGF